MRFLISIGFIIYIASWLFSANYKSNLTCHRSQDFCQLSSKRIIGAKTENFPIKTLSSADWVIPPGENSSSGVILKTAQGDKEMVCLFSSEAEEMAKQINAFISNYQQESLQVSSSNATAAWIIFWVILFNSLVFFFVLSTVFGGHSKK